MTAYTIQERWGARPKLGQFPRAVMDAFRADYPIRIPLSDLDTGTDGTEVHRKKAIQFFMKLGSPIATSGTAIYLTNQNDVMLLKLGMYR